MKLTCDRERMLTRVSNRRSRGAHAQPQADSAKRQARRPRRRRHVAGHGPGSRGSALKCRASRPRCPGSVVLPIQRFGSILRESGDATLRLETDGSGVVVRGEHSEFRLPAENPAEFPAVSRFQRAKISRRAGTRLVADHPPHDLCHRQREQPLCPGGRADRIERRQDHGRGHRRATPGHDGSPGAKRRRAFDRRQHDDRSRASMHLIEKILTEPDAEIHIATRGQRDSGEEPAGDDCIRGWSKGGFRSGATFFRSGPTQ